MARKVDTRPFEEQLADLPVALRPAVAQAYNARLRYLRSKNETKALSEQFKREVRVLYHRHQMNPNRIGSLMGVHRDWVLEMVGDK